MWYINWGQTTTPETIKIEHIRELFNSALRATSAIRIAAGNLDRLLEPENTILSAIFAPINSHAKDISDWLLKREDITLDKEFDKI